MDSQKFSTSGFWWIYIFWDVLNTIWPFLENVCLYVVCHQNFVDTVSQKLMHGKWWNFMLLHLDVIWCWLDFGISQNCMQLYLIHIMLHQSLWNWKYLFIITIVISYMIFVYMGAIVPYRGGSNPHGWKKIYHWYFQKEHLKMHKINIWTTYLW